MRRFEKLMFLLAIIYIIVSLALVFAIRANARALRDYSGAVIRAGDRPVQMEVKYIK